MERNKLSWLTLFIGPSAIWLLLLFVLPMGAMALFTFRAGSFGAEREVFTLEHYRDFLSQRSYHLLLWRSTWMSLWVAVLSIVLSYPVAHYLVFRAGDRRILYLLILMVPGWISFLLRIFAWKVILGSGGALNSLLLWSGLIHEATPILLYSPLAVVVVLVYVWIPFAALPIFAALQRIDNSLLEAAADLGSPQWETFLRVVLLLDETRAALKVQSVDIPPPGDLGLARISKITLTAPFPRGAATLRWSYAASFGDSILRAYSDPQKPPATAWLKDGAQSKTIPLGVAVKTKWHQTALEYVVLGFTHIVPKGLDHILFVVGLFLLSPRLKPLLVQITSFTVAHSVTLALAVLGWVDVPVPPVEASIALSIVFVARAAMQPGGGGWRHGFWLVVAFGMLHGLGFASVLAEIGLPRNDLVLGLLSFNLGVEIGQLLFVFAVLSVQTAISRMLRSQTDMGWVRTATSFGIGSTAVFWVFERVAAFAL